MSNLKEIKDKIKKLKEKRALGIEKFEKRRIEIRDNVEEKYKSSNAIVLNICSQLSEEVYKFEMKDLEEQIIKLSWLLED